MTTKILCVDFEVMNLVSAFANKESGVMRIDGIQKLHVSLHTIIQVSHGAVSTLQWCSYDGGHYTGGLYVRSLPLSPRAS